jgi:cutinase
MKSSLFLPLCLGAAVGAVALPTDGTATTPASTRTVDPPATLTVREPVEDDDAAAPLLLLAARSSLNDILAWIAALFPVDAVISDVTGLITTADSALALLAGWPMSQNDLEAGAACADVLLVYARGTSEPGNVGALVGPPFFEAAESRLTAAGKTLAIQGVDDYDASVEGFLVGGEASGSQKM